MTCKLRGVGNVQKFGFIKRVDKGLNYHRERFRKLTFRALALRQSEVGNVHFNDK